ncbi:glutathione S-transferase family protein [Jannaschia aquimarina]|uniref:YfcG_6 protein n=1 Tax=Jannaschia aquimarina TaxID=935700 RepID=A0A0D1D553_9RHOB|nr:glutathione S-transferase family protein [Jannaschia aquimarina]KIT15158.1 Disulfide-bond oxidoreductase YfcG [Jannaschia aquimarina]SNT23833.1 glutathione S-transferase [Jannaschia aquimarina]
MIRLHHVPASRSFRVLWMLEELGLEAEIVTYAIGDGSLRAPEVLALTPAGRVPALEIDGQALFESGAIVEYLAETRAEAGLGRPVGHPDRGRYLQCLHFAETQASLIENLNLSHIFLRPPARPSIPVLKITTARLKATLGALERLLEWRDHLLGDFSAADVMLGFNLWAAPRYVRMAPFPALAAYRDRLAARPAFVAARAKDGEQDFYDREFYEILDV